MSLLLNMLSRLVITFLPRRKRLLILWLQSPSTVILEPPKIKSDTVSTVSPSISHEVMGPDAMIFIFWMLSFKPTFSLSTFTFIKRLFSSSSLSATRMVSSAYQVIDISPGNLDINWGEILSFYCFKYFCSPFSFFSWYFIVKYVTPFVVGPQFLNILFLFQSFFFLLHFGSFYS